MITVGSRVKYIRIDTDEDKKLGCYPPTGTLGTVQQVVDNSYLVKWDNGTKDDGVWWCDFGDVLEVATEVNLVGFIHQYGENDFSIWGVQLSEEDKNAISSILEKYQTSGISVRGSAQMTLEEIL